MLLKNIIDKDTKLYHKPYMLINMPACSLKCEQDCGKNICTSRNLINKPTVYEDDYKIIRRYLDNVETDAIVFSGLEPFDTPTDLLNFIQKFRRRRKVDDIVIYTGYKEEDIYYYTEQLKRYKNIIVKFGRYIPNSSKVFDSILEVELPSDNQYAKKIS